MVPATGLADRFAPVMGGRRGARERRPLPAPVVLGTGGVTLTAREDGTVSMSLGDHAAAMSAHAWVAWLTDEHAQPRTWVRMGLSPGAYAELSGADVVSALRYVHAVAAEYPRA